jgi:hypothetical protein
MSINNLFEAAIPQIVDDQGILAVVFSLLHHVKAH